MPSQSVLTRQGAEMMLGMLPPGSCVISPGIVGGAVAWWVDDALGRVISGAVPEGTSVEDFQAAWLKQYPHADAAKFEAMT